MSLSALIERLRKIMRKDKGVDGDAQRLSQIVWLIFLKIFDFKEEEGELSNAYEPVIPEGYRWRDWADTGDVKNAMTGDELLHFVNNILIPVLKGDGIEVEGKRVHPFDKTDDRSLMVKKIMSDTVNYMKDGYILREVIDTLNEVDFADSAEAHQFNEMYESMLRGLQSAGSSGEFYTNRAITSFAIEKINPQIGGVLADWAAGTGGFLVDGLEHLARQVGNSAEAQKLLQTSIRGGEFKPLPYKLLITNLLLHDIELPDIHYGDSLDEKNFGEYMADDLVDYEAMNPPYGGVASQSDKLAFPADMRSSETADLFVALEVKRLKQGGRAVIVLPDGFLFGNDNAKLAIKKYLMGECRLHTIIRLPQSCFAPYTSIATNLLFFDKTGPTHDVWYYRLDMPEGYKHFSKTKPMLKEHFDGVRKWWDDREEIIDEKTDEAAATTYKSKCYTMEEIKANGYNLDLCGYPSEEKIILSPEETMSRFVERREKLDKKMDEQLARIREMLEVKG